MLKTVKLLTLSLICVAFAAFTSQASSHRVKILLDICDVAVQNNDEGTVQSIATQLYTLERPDDLVMQKQYDVCLTTAFGNRPELLDLDSILKQIKQASETLEKNCNQLLKVSPEIAVTHPVCKEILLK